jgi:Tfp pilus assembly protein PilZ
MNTPLEYEEKRRNPRIPCFVAVEYVAQGRAYTEFIRNTSRGGMFIETYWPFMIGETLSLTFSPPNKKRPIKISGEVVRTNPKGIGVKCESNPIIYEGDRETKKRKTLIGRRKLKRHRVREGVYALINKNSSIMGEVKEINTKGLSFNYHFDGKFVPVSSKIDIIYLNDNFRLSGMSYTRITDLRITKEVRRCSILFGNFTESQLFQLKLLITKYAIGQV